MLELVLDWPLVAAVLGALFAGTIKGASATGFPLIATPILTLALGPRPAVLAISLPTLLLNTLQTVRAPRPPEGSRWAYLQRALPVIAGELVGLPLGVWFLTNLDARALSVLIGAAVLLFAAYSVRFPAATLPPGRLTAALGAGAGFVGGWMGGTTGFFGPPLTVYLFALKLDKDVFVFLISLVYQVVNVAQVGIYLAAGLYTPEVLVVGVGLCVPALLGFHLGVRLRPHLDQRTFYRVILVVLMVSGLSAVIRPFLS